MQEESKIIQISAENDGTRIDIFLARELPTCSRSMLQRLLRAGNITVNGHGVRPSEKLHVGDVIRCAPEKLENKVLPEELPLDILYEDEDILVVNKPAGLIVHPTPHDKQGTLVNALLAYCDTEDFNEMLDDNLRPGIVHRLDKDTSGVLLIAKKADIAVKLKEDFKAHGIHKTYLALLQGTMTPTEGDIQLPIGRNPRNKVKMAVVEQGGKEAWTEYKTLASNEYASLVKIRLHTGRTHQIRVHFSHFGHPVLGDILYGKLKGPYHPERQMLHAWKIAFKHPRTGKVLRLSAPVPEDFQSMAIAIMPSLANKLTTSN